MLEQKQSFLQKFLSTPEQKKFDREVQKGEFILMMMGHAGNLANLIPGEPWELDRELERLDH